jgi:hypothetical protein
LVALDPLRFEDVRHGTNLATAAASDDSPERGWRVSRLGASVQLALPRAAS